MKNSILCIAALGILSSCSVVMAAKKEGVSVMQVQSCHTRPQILSSGAVLVDSCRLETGELMETYQVQQERGSAARAFMHGVLDVSTFGLWEVVGTPIEACTNKKTYYFIRVTYNEKEVVTRLELL